MDLLLQSINEVSADLVTASEAETLLLALRSDWGEVDSFDLPAFSRTDGDVKLSPAREPTQDGRLITRACSDSVQFSQEPAAPWLFGFTPSFQKSIKLADRSLQGRILLALRELAENPTMLRGDTIKPLSGSLRGLWRYRIGDYRLIFKPDVIKRTVTLYVFAPRGTAYEGDETA